MAEEDRHPIRVSTMIRGLGLGAPLDNLGPAWVQLHADGRVSIDSPQGVPALALSRFIWAAVTHAGALDSNRYAYGTAYAVRNPVGCTAGELYFDGGRYDPDRQVTRVVTAWSSDGTPVMNAFTPLSRPVFDARIAGLSTSDLPPGVLIQPPNAHLVEFDEGIHLHGRVATAPNRDAYGVFFSLALYRPGQAPDLHCPRLADLRDWGPLAELADDYRSSRTTY